LLCGALTFGPPGRLASASVDWALLWRLTIAQLHTQAIFTPAGVPRAVRDRIEAFSSDSDDDA